MDIGTCDYSVALVLIKQGKKLARNKWNPFASPEWNSNSRKFVYLVSGSRFTVNRPPLNAMYEEGTVIDYRPHIDMRDSDGTCGVWSATNEDMLADDWIVME